MVYNENMPNFDLISDTHVKFQAMGQMIIKRNVYFQCYNIYLLYGPCTHRTFDY